MHNSQSVAIAHGLHYSHKNLSNFLSFSRRVAQAFFQIMDWKILLKNYLLSHYHQSITIPYEDYKHVFVL